MQRFSLYGVHKRDYQESVTIGQTDARTHTQTDAGQSDPYVPLCFAGDTKIGTPKTLKSVSDFPRKMSNGS